VLSGQVNESKYTYKKNYYTDKGEISRVESYVEGEQARSGVNVEQRMYDDKSNIIKKVTYNTLDSVSKNVIKYEHKENREKLDCKIDQDKADEVATQSVDWHTGKQTGLTQSDETGQSSSTSVRYNAGEVTRLTSGLNTVNYEYDGKRRKIRVVLNGTEHSKFAYTDASSSNAFVDTMTQTQVTGTSAVVTETRTDVRGNVLTKRINKLLQHTNTYHIDGRLNTSTDNVRNVITTKHYDNVMQGRVNSVSVGSLKEDYAYDANGSLSKRSIRIGTSTVSANNLVYEYVYKSNYARELDYTTTPQNMRVYPTTDVLGRDVGKVVTSNSNTRYAEYKAYVKYGDRTTNLVSNIRYSSGSSLADTLKYKYDDRGNIVEERLNGRLDRRYEYDSIGRLTREDNRTHNKTTVWTYDNSGNILSRRQGVFSLERDSDKVSLGNETLYRYDGNNSDRLIEYGSETFAYDNIGNPTRYRSNAMTWERGSLLATYRSNSNGDDEMTYKQK
jgi:YD repeat-containing protein